MATSPPRVSPLARGMQEVYFATKGTLFKPDYIEICFRLNVVNKEGSPLPERYKTNVSRPLLKYLEGIGEEVFYKIFSDIGDEKTKRWIEELTDALVQYTHFSASAPDALRDLQAFQTLISGIYEDILRERIREISTVAIPLAPLAKWGAQLTSAYTKTSGSLESLIPGINAGIVNLPSVCRTGGLYAWMSIGHEVAGHNFLQAVPGLLEEIQGTFHDSVASVGHEHKEMFVDYWAACCEEIASDFLGVLSFGGGFALGFLGFLRAARGGCVKSSGYFHTNGAAMRRAAMFTSSGRREFYFELNRYAEITLKKGKAFGVLRGAGRNLVKLENIEVELYKSTRGKHPIDILRFFVLEEVIKILPHDEGEFQLLQQEVQEDFECAGGRVELTPMDYTKMPPNQPPIVLDEDYVRHIAQIIAERLMKHRFEKLGKKPLSEFIMWKEKDELLAGDVQESYKAGKEHLSPGMGIQSRHIIAGAVKASIDAEAIIEKIFADMKLYLAHDYSQRESLRSNITDKSS